MVEGKEVDGGYEPKTWWKMDKKRLAVASLQVYIDICCTDKIR